MLNLVIISKDDIQSLNLLIDSVYKNISNLNKIRPFVIYQASDKNMSSSYEQLNNELKDFAFIEGTHSIKNDISELLSDNKDNEKTLFFKDNDVLYDNVDDIDPIINTIDNNEDVFCFSLRLGKNITKCATMEGAENIFRDYSYLGDEVLKWNWQDHYLDFGFPFSLSGHIFRTKEIKKLIKKTRASSPEEVEESLLMFDSFPRDHMASFKKSKSVTIDDIIFPVPDQDGNEKRVNKTQGGNVAYYYLNTRFMKGSRLTTEQLDFDAVEMCNTAIEVRL